MAALLVALVMLVAGVLKIARSTEWQVQAAALGVPGAIAAVVPFIEIGLGAALVVQWQRRSFAWAAALLLVAFTLLLIVRLAQGKRPPCACFGSLSARPIGLSHIARNALFIGLAVLAATL